MNTATRGKKKTSRADYRKLKRRVASHMADISSNSLAQPGASVNPSQQVDLLAGSADCFNSYHLQWPIGKLQWPKQFFKKL